MFNELVVQFAQIWDEYVRAFSIWKTNDATALEAELVRIAVAMEGIHAEKMRRSFRHKQMQKSQSMIFAPSASKRALIESF